MKTVKKHIAWNGNDFVEVPAPVPNEPSDVSPKATCGHGGPDWNGEGDCIKCARDKVLGSEPSDSALDNGRDNGEPSDGCPCKVIEPCSSQCSCANGFMSGGCYRCAKYGSQEQREAAAKRIASLVDPKAIPSAIGDELDEQVDFILADQQETIGKVLLKKRILTFVEEQTKLARLEERKQVKMYNELTRIGREENDNRIADLEASIKERSKDERS